MGKNCSQQLCTWENTTALKGGELFAAACALFVAWLAFRTCKRAVTCMGGRDANASKEDGIPIKYTNWAETCRTRPDAVIISDIFLYFY